MKLDPSNTAEFDQAQARIRDAVDKLVEALIDASKRCPCGGAIDSTQHRLSLIEYLMICYPSDLLPVLLAEAVGRLAVTRAAEQ